MDESDHDGDQLSHNPPARTFLGSDPASAEGVGLYLHVPFCARACPYCDFDFVVGRSARLGPMIDRWLVGLEQERLARAAAGELALEIDTVYLGGGTPSVLAPEQLRRLFAWLREGLAIDPGSLRELTVELNPEHVDHARLDALVELGVGRVSLGVQTLAPTGLRELGRAHDPAAALAAVARCVERGLRTSADLILGWRGQGIDQLRRDLDALVERGVEHVSIYGLTIEPDTPWLKLVGRGLRVLPDEDLQAELLLAAEAELEARGFVHYEVASYARPGAEAIHNSKYWRWVDVIGLGPSAASVRHGRGQGGAVVERRSNPRGLEPWVESLVGSEAPILERLEGTQAAAEGLWLGLRRLRGLPVGAFLARFGVERSWLEARIARQLRLGNLEWADEGARLRVAPGRWLWHDTIAVDVLG
ncbi:MAG: coproporphyrinogen-III oxidase family protein [Enhygromyxa sp.]